MKSSNFTCELLANQNFLKEYINLQEAQKVKKLAISIDSKAALQAIQKGDLELVLNTAHNTLHKILNLSKKCIIHLVLAYIGIHENETKSSTMINYSE